MRHVQLPCQMTTSKGKTMNKSIITLCFIALLAGTAHARENPVKVDILAQSSQSWDGRQLPAYPTTTPEISVLRIEIPAGTQLALHQHPVINVGYLVSGELTVITEQNETLHLKAGDALIEVVDKWHYGKNEGSTPAVIVVVYAGTPGTPLSVHKE
jgi:quercetin dioxygenase-like cupin family protein